MAAWSGFTDEDLRKMRTLPQEGNSDERRQAPKKGMLRHPKASAQRQRGNKPTAQTIEPSQSLQRTKSDEGHVNKERVNIKAQNNSVSSQEMNTQLPEATKVEEEKAEVKELNTDQVLSMERDNVAKFQQQQKVIEEANKQKRKLLSKAIDERRKMAKAESEKLLKIQRELNHLDDLLNVDVGIIRDKIEIASLDYVHAQKRYEKAEKEFIESKMDLYEKSESKEKLTEHLYTIINQNEIRKAKKLVELMEQLAMQISPEEMELTIPAIPQLTNFTAASTLHHPHALHRHESDTAEDGNCKQKGNDSGEGRGDNSEEAVTSKDDQIQDIAELNEEGDGKKADADVTSSSFKDENKNSSGDVSAEHSSPNNIDSTELPTSDKKNVEDNLQYITSSSQNRNNPEGEVDKVPMPTQNSSDIPTEPPHHPNQDNVTDKNQMDIIPSGPKDDDTTNKVKGWSLPFM